jgi:hypothetical protein
VDRGRWGRGGLERHPSLDDRFDPAVRIVDYDPARPALADAELRRVKGALGEVAVGPRVIKSSDRTPAGSFARPLETAPRRILHAVFLATVRAT